ncbi:hypothetical protein GCM10017688_56690 [Streptomyces ramulosus]
MRRANRTSVSSTPAAATPSSPIPPPPYAAAAAIRRATLALDNVIGMDRAPPRAVRRRAPYRTGRRAPEMRREHVQQVVAP